MISFSVLLIILRIFKCCSMKCVGVDGQNKDDCVLCAPGYQPKKPMMEKIDKFLIDECIEIRNSKKPITLEKYVTSEKGRVLSMPLGTLTDPYLSLIEGISVFLVIVNIHL
jgi:hypothetical protein